MHIVSPFTFVSCDGELDRNFEQLKLIGHSLGEPPVVARIRYEDRQRSQSIYLFLLTREMDTQCKLMQCE